VLTGVSHGTRLVLAAGIGLPTDHKAKGASVMAQKNESQFRVGLDTTVKWSKAGDRKYEGITLVRELPDGTCQAIFRLTDRTTPGEYRAFAVMAREAADLAEECAKTVESALKPDKAQTDRIREALKNAAKPADRVALVVALGTMGLTVSLADFGYDPATGKAVAEKAPTAPTISAADILAAAGVK